MIVSVIYQPAGYAIRSQATPFGCGSSHFRRSSSIIQLSERVAPYRILAQFFLRHCGPLFSRQTFPVKILLADPPILPPSPIAACLLSPDFRRNFVVVVDRGHHVTQSIDA
jgi:hypothetical protein